MTATASSTAKTLSACSKPLLDESSIMTRFFAAAVAFLSLMTGFAQQAPAHQTGQSMFVAHVITDTGKIDTLLNAPPVDIAHAAQIDPGDDGIYDPAELHRSWPQLGFYTDPHIEVTNDGEPCEVVEHRTSPAENPTEYWFLKAFQCPLPLGEVKLTNSAMAETTGGYRHIGKIQVDDDLHTTVFNRASPSFVLALGETGETTSVPDTMGRFVWEGILHIVFGWDHVLFVLGLVLLARRLRQLLIVVTAFTLSHSVTLALSALDIVSLSPGFVEPVIALSIAWVAVEVVVDRDDRRAAYVVTFLLGLVHGFGFSYVLRDEVGLPTDALLPALLSFNVGVELGQLGIVAIAYPLRAWIRDRVWERKVVVGAALIVALIALYWFVERTFLA